MAEKLHEPPSLREPKRYRKWFGGPLLSAQSSDTLRAWGREPPRPPCGPAFQKAIVIAAGLLILFLVIGQVSVVSLTLLFVLVLSGLGVDIAHSIVRQTFHIDLRSRTFHWYQSAVWTINECRGDLNNDCCLVVEESRGVKVSRHGIYGRTFTTISFRAAREGLQLPIFRTDRADGLQEAIRLRDRLGIPVEIGSYSIDLGSHSPSAFPKPPLVPRELVKVEDENRLRIGAPKFTYDATPMLLLACCAAFLWSPLGRVWLVNIHGMDSAMLQTVRYVAAIVAALAYAAFTPGIQDWLFGKPETTIELVAGKIVVSEVRTGRAPRLRALCPISDIANYLYNPGNPVSRSELLLLPNGGRSEHGILAGHDEETIRWVANWLIEKTGPMPKLFDPQ